MPNYAELRHYADYAAPMQLCRYIMLASRGMPNWRCWAMASSNCAMGVTECAVALYYNPSSTSCGSSTPVL
jgi:hypothetical protein